MTEKAGATEPIASPSHEYVVQRFRVEVVAGPDAGKRAVATRDELLVGTAPGNDLVLADPTVSRQHIAVASGPRGFTLADLGSSNGTTVSGVRVERAFLKSGCAIGLGHSALRFEVESDPLRAPLSATDRFGRLLGRSSAMRRIFAVLPRLAASDATVLLEGETGTGKSLLADAIHQESARRSGPFVVVDCGAIAPSLIESELFGHERGAFTGATGTRVGAFESARGGTIFLDEVGELPLELQPKLLRALEDRVVKRVGGSEPIKLDVRVVAATHRDLKREVNRGTFRADLFYRLQVVSLRIPSLRERPEDVPLYVEHFAEQMRRADEPALPDDVVVALGRRSWPGNIRELRGAVERAVLLGAEADAVQGLEGPSDARTTGVVEHDFVTSFRAAKERAIGAWERLYLAELIRRNQANLSRAARAARMDRTHLRELLRRYGLKAEAD